MSRKIRSTRDRCRESACGASEREFCQQYFLPKSQLINLDVSHPPPLPASRNHFLDKSIVLPSHYIVPEPSTLVVVELSLASSIHWKEAEDEACEPINQQAGPYRRIKGNFRRKYHHSLSDLTLNYLLNVPTSKN